MILSFSSRRVFVTEALTRGNFLLYIPESANSLKQAVDGNLSSHYCDKNMSQRITHPS